MKNEFSFVMSIDDMISYHELHIDSSKTYRRSLLINRLIMPVVAFAVWIIATINQDIGSLKYIFMVMAVIWYFVWPARQRNKTLTSIRQMIDEKSNSSFLGVHNVVIDDQTIRCNYPGGSAVTSISSIIDIKQNDKVLLLYNSSISALIFPLAKIPKEIVDDIVSKVKLAQQVDSAEAATND